MYIHRPKPSAKVQVELEQEFWQRVEKYRWLFQICPHISWVGVCNSLPMHTLKDSSDIDLFIVTKKNKLFTSRLWVTLLTQVFGVRRHGQKTRKRFCLSFFAEEGFENLEGIAIEDDIYLARWIQTLQPIAGNHNSYKAFLKKNQKWTRPLVGHLKVQEDRFKSRGFISTVIRNTLSLTTILFEKPLKTWQLKRSKEKAENLKDGSGTIINAHQLKFHDKDRRKQFRDEWKA
jgi:hypothetical protein